MIDNPACSACEATRSEPTYAGLRRCVQCTHVWADMTLDWTQLQQIYGRKYFFGDEYSNYLGDREVLEKNFARRLRTLSAFQQASHQELLEVGCAYGLFLRLAAPSFRHVKGVDISACAVAHATDTLGLDAVCGDFLSMDFGDARFDVACMWDTIEHLADPREYVIKVASLLRQGGLLALTTGDIGSLNARLQRERWRLIHPPTHLQYFTRASLCNMLERAGFRVVHVEHCGFSRNIASMVRSLIALRWGRPALADRVSAWLPKRADLYLNLHDILYVIAERC